MIDVDLIDRLFEASYGSEHPIIFCMFDRRITLPIAQMAAMVTDRSGDATSPEDIRRFARDGWLRLEPRDEGEGEDDVGASPYVVERIVFFKTLQREGWGNAELADYAEFEDVMVEDFADEEDGFPYIDDDLGRLIQYCRARIEALSCGTPHDGAGNFLDPDDELKNARKELAFLERLQTDGVPPDLKENIARHAFRVRASDEAMCVMIVEGWRAQLRAGFTINVSFDGTGSKQGENGERVFTHGELNWHSTIRAAYGANEGKSSEPTIRVPGFVLCGDRVMTAKTVRPHEYDRMWKEAGIESYLTAWAEIRNRPMCMNCFDALPEPNPKNAQYCSQKCRDAAKARRYRGRNPDSAARAREKYRASIAEDE